MYCGSRLNPVHRRPWAHPPSDLGAHPMQEPEKKRGYSREEYRQAGVGLLQIAIAVAVGTAVTLAFGLKSTVAPVIFGLGIAFGVTQFTAWRRQPPPPQ